MSWFALSLMTIGGATFVAGLVLFIAVRGLR